MKCTTALGVGQCLSLEFPFYRRCSLAIFTLQPNNPNGPRKMMVDRPGHSPSLQPAPRYRPPMRIVLACLVVMTDLSASSNRAAAFSLIGPGVASCGTWTAHRRNQGAVPSLADQAWVVGFLSGIGYVGRNAADPLNDVDAEAVWAWVDNYCKVNPLDTIAKAAEEFYWAHPH
jgi:hypothetical protein